MFETYDLNYMGNITHINTSFQLFLRHENRDGKKDIKKYTLVSIV